MADIRNKLKLYPHMMPNDIGIWETFLEVYPDMFDTIVYDYHVGDGWGHEEQDLDFMKRAAKALTQFRIDAVGFKEGKATIIEVKPYAQLSALGQLLGYKFHFEKERPEYKPVYLMVVTDKTTSQMKEVFDYYGITAVETSQL